MFIAYDAGTLTNNTLNRVRRLNGRRCQPH